MNNLILFIINKFVEYLWGIETYPIDHIKIYIIQFVEYLWGIETIYIF